MKKKIMHPDLEKLWDTFEKEIDNFDIAPILGSCQYKTIEDTYHLILGLLKHPNMGLEKTNKLWKITYSKILTLEEIEHNLYLTLEENHDTEDNPPFINYPDYDHANKRITIEQYTDYTKAEAWDLWSASIGPFPLDFTMGEDFKIPGTGPILNAFCQEENFNIGLNLAYLTFFHNIDLSLFADYDT